MPQQVSSEYIVKQWNSNWINEVPAKPRIDIYCLKIVFTHDQAT